MNSNVKKYRGCSDIIGGTLVFTSHIGEVKNCMTPCCHMSMMNLATELLDDPESTVNNFFKFRHNLNNENKKLAEENNNERNYTADCIDCPKYIVNEWDDVSDTLCYVSLAMAPAPCQSKCMYCAHLSKDNSLSDESKDAYERLIKLLKYMKEKNIITKDTTIQVASGEITIHPYKDQILEIVNGLNVKFFSNCFKFDQGIADHLRGNPQSSINLSIDSGTASTWKKVKGFNNFNRVVSNLRKYYNYCDQVNHQQIELKYIVMPEINTQTQDYNGIIKIMKDLNVKELIISREFSVYYQPSTKEYETLYENIITLASLCKINGLSYIMADGIFTQYDMNYIEDGVSKKLIDISKTK